mgnify:CR=1 FL=1
MKIINKWLVKLFQALLRALEEKERVDTQSKTKTLTEDKGVSLVLIRDTFTKKSIIGKTFLIETIYYSTKAIKQKIQGVVF